ncbi:phosphatase PAP2 family protein [Parasutterella secunda]|uniref:phosphatase PAP2 family protein n=1 Tax=Parasutterella secunda TaxID=626947 RepID=UPI0021AC094E|nr:phosphatase PAP2 family protein [Parasutterella secunda]MCR8920773.1 phosphatase PAP2 family protein [Parasutterella secunda]
MLFVSSLGNFGAIWIALAALLLIIERYRQSGLAVSIALLIDFVAVNLIIKPLVGRERPCDVTVPEDMLLACLSDHSFPSGHTAAAFAAAFALFLYHKRAGSAALILAFLMGFSRLYLFVHFPSDVIAGALLGLIFGFIGYKFALRRNKKAPNTGNGA